MPPFKANGGRSSEVRGLRELEKQLLNLVPDNPNVSKQLTRVVADASDYTADMMRKSAHAAGWPDQETIRMKKAGWKKAKDVTIPVVRAIFSSGDQPGGKAIRSLKISALAGISKRRSMVTWLAGRHPKGNARRSPGEEVAMSRATMLEFGTSNRPAKPAINSAIGLSRSGIIDRIAKGAKAILKASS